jgi:hypothetical protein
MLLSWSFMIFIVLGSCYFSSGFCGCNSKQHSDYYERMDDSDGKKGDEKNLEKINNGSWAEIQAVSSDHHSSHDGDSKPDNQAV